MDAEQLKKDVREGRIDVDRLVDLIASLGRQLDTANGRIEELERKLGGRTTTKLDEPYSVRSEEKRQRDRGRKRRKPHSDVRRGRVSTAEKIAGAVRTEQVFPNGVPKESCKLSHTRPVWRLEQGGAVIVAYDVYRGPKNQYGKIPGVLGRSEFGIEIVVAIAYQVYVVGLSLDKVCLLMNFFQNLALKKSQADALLNQLTRDWQSEFETLCTLLAHSAVVHADETSWSINSVWAFLSEQARVQLFGVHKDAKVLSKILDPGTFEGIVISDDAAVYRNFTNSQKCWAHLLRKAIKLTLLDPDECEYRRVTDGLLDIYREACRVQRDRRLGDAGRERKVAELDDRILDLCGGAWSAELPPQQGALEEYRLLCNEIMRLMLQQQLFTFVTAAPVKTPMGEATPVSGTNNESERTLRRSSEARKTGRTSKTLRGARRRTVIVSVLDSLRPYLPTYTLSSVIEEIARWTAAGKSCFAKLLEKLKLPAPTTSLLESLLPDPGG